MLFGICRLLYLYSLFQPPYYLLVVYFTFLTFPPLVTLFFLKPLERFIFHFCFFIPGGFIPPPDSLSFMLWYFEPRILVLYWNLILSWWFLISSFFLHLFYSFFAAYVFLITYVSCVVFYFNHLSLLNFFFLLVFTFLS